MATKNIRIVGYIPPPDHQKLREYMEVHSLTESAALVRILKDFFAEPSRCALDSPPRPAQTQIHHDRELETLKAEVERLKQRLGTLEAHLSTVRPPRRSNSFHSPRPQYAQPTLPPQTLPDLARRLGVSAETLAEAAEKGEAYFPAWSKRRDPSSRAWEERDGRFHPL